MISNALLNVTFVPLIVAVPRARNIDVHIGEGFGANDADTELLYIYTSIAHVLCPKSIFMLAAPFSVPSGSDAFAIYEKNIAGHRMASFAAFFIRCSLPSVIGF